MAFVFERGGNSIVGPAILHTSSNAPAIILALPQDVMAMALVMHMGVILVSIYLVFVSEQPVGDRLVRCELTVEVTRLEPGISWKVGRFFGSDF